jgi:hypothetical protein
MGYWDDTRYVGRDRAAVRGEFDEERMTLTVEIYDEDESTKLTVPARFEVCPTCGGRGKHVNPGIDDCGLTSEDFDEDPGFYEEYRRGAYDVACYECSGKRVVPVVDEYNCDPEALKLYEDQFGRATRDHAEQRRERAMGY